MHRSSSASNSASVDYANDNTEEYSPLNDNYLFAAVFEPLVDVDCNAVGGIWIRVDHATESLGHGAGKAFFFQPLSQYDIIVPPQIQDPLNKLE